jgi:predicted lipoprotein with Yx(FWY)xxD motif
MRRTGWVFVAVAGVALAACGSSGGGYGSGRGTSTTRAARSAYGDAAGSSTTAARTPASGATVVVRMTSLGNVLTDAAGKTLYLYEPDAGTTSKVPAAVLAAWPPLVASGTPTAGPGADAAKLRVATQPGGGKWVAYDGHLLYTFSGDHAPGDTNGQGLGGVWYAVAPTGAAISS